MPLGGAVKVFIAQDRNAAAACVQFHSFTPGPGCRCFLPNQTTVQPPPHYGITKKSRDLKPIRTHSALHEVVPLNLIFFEKSCCQAKQCNIPPPETLGQSSVTPWPHSGFTGFRGTGWKQLKTPVNPLWSPFSTCWVVSQRLSCFAKSGFVVTQIKCKPILAFVRKWRICAVISDPL